MKRGLDMDIIAFYKDQSEKIFSWYNRLNHFIGEGTNKAESGNFREAIIRKLLENSIPEGYRIKTGFIIGEDIKIPSTQIDLMILKPAYPSLFEYGDFAVAPIESVAAIIEVKSTIDHSAESDDGLFGIIQKARDIVLLHDGCKIFNGIIALESKITDFDKLEQNFSSFKKSTFSNKEELDYIYISLGSNIFIRNRDDNFKLDGGAYHFDQNLSLGYLIANLKSFLDFHYNPNPIELRKYIFPVNNKQSYGDKKFIF